MMKVISEGGLDILKLSLISEYQSQFNKAIFVHDWQEIKVKLAFMLFN